MYKVKAYATAMNTSLCMRNVSVQKHKQMSLLSRREIFSTIWVIRIRKHRTIGHTINQLSVIIHRFPIFTQTSHLQIQVCIFNQKLNLKKMFFESGIKVLYSLCALQRVSMAGTNWHATACVGFHRQPTDPWRSVSFL